ncbi:MAG: non-ribosomal peptide synthetase, partial [Desulfobacterales bacterium]|nr:non-ribosomal peptide synthetase [Desulfobacterales bacterium]
AIPLTPNGKIDRKALPVPEERGIYESSRGAPRDLTELRLLRIWEKTLNLHPIGLDENFFDLGGHSILAVRLMSHIQQDFGWSPPLSALFQAPTISQLAELMRERSDERSWTSLAPIRAEGSLSPLFCLPGAGGDVMYFHSLTVHLGPDRPVFGLRTPGLDGKTAPHARIEDLAAHHVGVIKSVQPRGPYTLCGHSLGGHTAFEMARRLQQAGEEVALLAVFDSLAPGEEDGNRFDPTDWDEAKWLERLAMIIGAMLGKEIRVTAEALRRLPADEQLPCLNEHLKRAGWIAPGADVARVRGLFRVFKANLLARYAPEPARLPRIVLFQAEDSLIQSDKPAWGWRDRADHPVMVHRIPGDHFTMLAEPNVKHLAEKLTDCMERAR